MLKRFLHLFRSSNPARNGRTGFVYTPQNEQGPLTQGKIGDVIRIQAAPPWIVVDHSKDSIVFTNWPGVLWKVEVVEPAPDSEQVTSTYTRSKAVRLIETSTATELFGVNGDAVEQILNQAAQLELVQIKTARPFWGDSVNAYSRAWNAWIKNRYPNETMGNYESTLGVGSCGYDSPIGRGFVLLFNVVHNRAMAIEGDSAFSVDEEGESHFLPHWQIAFDAARFAAMAYGAPELLSEQERQILTATWSSMMKPA
jgi:hypothetical protein